MTSRPSLVKTDQSDLPGWRRARVERLTVDHLPLLELTIGDWSPEAVEPEARLSRIRKNVTMQERIDAWRGFFKMTEKA